MGVIVFRFWRFKCSMGPVMVEVSKSSLRSNVVYLSSMRVEGVEKKVVSKLARLRNHGGSDHCVHISSTRRMPFMFAFAPSELTRTRRIGLQQGQALSHIFVAQAYMTAFPARQRQTSPCSDLREGPSRPVSIFKTSANQF